MKNKLKDFVLKKNIKVKTQIFNYFISFFIIMVLFFGMIYPFYLSKSTPEIEMVGDIKVPKNKSDKYDLTID